MKKEKGPHKLIFCERCRWELPDYKFCGRKGVCCYDCVDKLRNGFVVRGVDPIFLTYKSREQDDV